MEFSQLSLRQKGLIIVLPPVVFNLIFLGVFSSLLIDAENQYEKRRSYREFQIWTYETESLLASSISRILVGLEGDDGSFLKDSVNLEVNLNQAVKSITEFIKERPAEKEQLSNLLELSKSGLKLLEKAESVYKDKSIQPSKRAKYLRSDFNILMLEVQPRMFALAKKEIQIASRTSILYTKSPLIIAWIFLGFGLNGILTLKMLSMFNFSMVNRLEHLKEQSERMAVGAKPLEIASGSDELVNLEKRLIEAAYVLEQRRKRERVILDSANEVICSIDTNKRFSTIGTAVEKLLSYEIDQLLGKVVSEILSKKDKKPFLNKLDEIKEQGIESCIEVLLIKNDGLNLPASCTISWNQETCTWLCIIRDITERKKLQKVKERFIATISHDIRSPLASISNSIQLLLEGTKGPIPDKVSRVFERVKASIAKLITLAQDLLEIERLESGKLVMESQYVSTYDVCTSACELLDSFAQKRGIKIDSDVTDIGVLGDEKRVVHIIVNLLSNAIKFSNPDSKIELQAKQVDGFAEISVKDYGQGIKEDDLALIFERFGQAKQASTTEYKSSGLGLAICKGIIEAMSGEIGVESRHLKGCRFWIRLPLFPGETEDLDVV